MNKSLRFAVDVQNHFNQLVCKALNTWHFAQKRVLFPAWLLGYVLFSIVTEAAYCQDSIARPADSSVEKYEALVRELEIASNEHRRGLVQLSSEEQFAARHRSPYRTFEPRFVGLAEELGDSNGAFMACKWLVDHASPGPSLDRALDILGDRFLVHSEMSQMCLMLPDRLSPGIEAFLVKVGEKHPQPQVRGLAYFCVADYLSRLHHTTARRLLDESTWLAKAKYLYREDAIDWLQRLSLERLRDRFQKSCRVLHARYEDTLSPLSNRSFGDLARSLEFAFDPVGKHPLAFRGIDSQGNNLDLSMFKGRVAVVMFSANWCGPCKLMYGQLRDLKREHANRDFEIVTVMADKEASTVRDAVDSGDITWPAIWDGESGPIAIDWHIKYYPTIYLIDSQGFVAARDLSADTLEQKVAKLLGVDWKPKSPMEKRSRVRELDLRNQGVQSADLPELLKGYTDLRSLDLSENPIGDDAIAHLYHLKNLTDLHLAHTDVSDHGLALLEPMKSLKTVGTYAGPGSTITAEGRRQLKRLIPGVTVTFVTN